MKNEVKRVSTLEARNGEAFGEIDTLVRLCLANALSECRWLSATIKPKELERGPIGKNTVYWEGVQAEASVGAVTGYDDSMRSGGEGVVLTIGFCNDLCYGIQSLICISNFDLKFNEYDSNPSEQLVVFYPASRRHTSGYDRFGCVLNQ